MVRAYITHFRALCTITTVALGAVVGCSAAKHDNNDDIDRPKHRSVFGDKIHAIDGEVQIHLDFSGSAISDDDLAAIPFPDTVRSISLRDTKVTDRGVLQLQRARNLEKLDLGNTQVTNQILDILADIASLRTVYVTSPNYSQDNQEKLRVVLARHSRTRLAKPAINSER